MGNGSSEVEAYMKSEAFSGRGKRVKKACEPENVEEKGEKISAEERDEILNKVRLILETGNGEFLTMKEEAILKEIAGVYYSAYKKAIEAPNNSKQGGIDNER